MHQPLRLARRARGIQDVQQVLCVHPLRRAIVLGRGHQVVPPQVAPGLHLGALRPHRLAQRRVRPALIHHHIPHRRAALHRLVHNRLQPNLRAPPVAHVLRHHRDALRIVHPVHNRLRREPSEDHRMHCPDPRARQHRNRQLRPHPHVDRHPVAAPHSQPLQRVGEPLHLSVQLAVADPPHLARLALPQQRRLLPPRPQRVPVHAVVAQVQLAANEPLRRAHLPFENLLPRRKPLQPARRLRPESLRLLHAVPVHRLILFQALDVRTSRKLRRRRKHPVLPQQRLHVRPNRCLHALPPARTSAVALPRLRSTSDEANFPLDGFLCRNPSIIFSSP